MLTKKQIQIIRELLIHKSFPPFRSSELKTISTIPISLAREIIQRELKGDGSKIDRIFGGGTVALEVQLDGTIVGSLCSDPGYQKPSSTRFSSLEEGITFYLKAAEKEIKEFIPLDWST